MVDAAKKDPGQKSFRDGSNKTKYNKFIERRPSMVKNLYKGTLLLKDEWYEGVNKAFVEGAIQYERDSLLDMLGKNGAMKEEKKPSTGEALHMNVEQLSLRGTFGLTPTGKMEKVLRMLSRTFPGATCVKPCQTIMTKVDLSGMPLGNDTCLLLAALLRMKDCSLVELRLCNCRIESEGVDALGDALQENECLQKITLVEANLPIQLLRGASTHFSLEKYNLSLEKMDLSYAKIECMDLVLIAKLMLRNEFMRTLDMAHNDVLWCNSLWGTQTGRFHGFLHLIRSILHINQLTSLDLSYCHLMSEGLDTFRW
jgi:hypothetical protein